MGSQAGNASKKPANAQTSSLEAPEYTPIQTERGIRTGSATRTRTKNKKAETREGLRLLAKVI